MSTELRINVRRSDHRSTSFLEPGCRPATSYDFMIPDEYVPEIIAEMCELLELDLETRTSRDTGLAKNQLSNEYEQSKAESDHQGLHHHP